MTKTIILQRIQPDSFFCAEQQQKLMQLMAEWRRERDQGQSLPAQAQHDLEALVKAELLSSQGNRELQT